MTKSLHTRFKEYLAHLKYRRLDKSSVAMYMVINRQNINIQQIKLLKNVKYVNQLDATEILEIIKYRGKLVNSGAKSIPDSSLLEFAANWSK